MLQPRGVCKRSSKRIVKVNRWLATFRERTGTVGPERARVLMKMRLRGELKSIERMKKKDKFPCYQLIRLRYELLMV